MQMDRRQKDGCMGLTNDKRTLSLKVCSCSNDLENDSSNDFKFLMFSQNFIRFF
jgi:hypothetical protein